MTIIDELAGDGEIEATAIYAHLFSALADPSRLAVLQHLATGEHRVRELVEHVGLAQSTVSKHLSYLHECGLIVRRPDGRSSWYSLAKPAATMLLFNAAENLLEATGNPASLGMHVHGVDSLTGVES